MRGLGTSGDAEKELSCNNEAGIFVWSEERNILSGADC